MLRLTACEPGSLLPESHLTGRLFGNMLLMPAPRRGPGKDADAMDVGMERCRKSRRKQASARVQFTCEALKGASRTSGPRWGGTISTSPASPRVYLIVY